jgi:hypothetical protein
LEKLSPEYPVEKFASEISWSNSYWL